MEIESIDPDESKKGGARIFVIPPCQILKLIRFAGARTHRCFSPEPSRAQGSICVLRISVSTHLNGERDREKGGAGGCGREDGWLAVIKRALS